VYGVVKTGFVSSSLMESVKNYTGRLPSDNVLLVCSSTNHLEIGKSKGAIKHIMNFLKRNYHTNIISLSVLQRYDSINSLYITNKNEAFNRKLMKLAKTFSHTRILEIYHNRSLFIKHGLYLNKLVTELLSKQIVSLAYSVLEKEKNGFSYIRLVYRTKLQLQLLIFNSN
jgi:hypothetical protein